MLVSYLGFKECFVFVSCNLFIYLHLLNLINNRILQILQRYHAGSRVDGPPQVTVVCLLVCQLLSHSVSLSVSPQEMETEGPRRTRIIPEGP